MEKLIQEGRFALRRLVRNPGFTLVAIVTLALGIGLNTSMFSLANTLLLRPFPYPDADDLLKLNRRSGKMQTTAFSPVEYRTLREAETNFGQFASYYHSIVSLSEPGRPAESHRNMRVSANYFEMLGVRPELGRFFQASEETEGNHRVAVITHALWTDRFAAAPDVIGKMIRCNGEQFEIIGVLREGDFDKRVFGQVSLFSPLGLGSDQINSRGLSFLGIIGRQKSGMSEAQARGFIASVGAQLAKEFPAEFGSWRWEPLGLREASMAPRGRVLLGMLLGMAGFVLLIACSNLANFLLARAISRAREFAVRAALGASKFRLLAPLGMESLALALLGGVGALLVASWTGDWLDAQSRNFGGDSLGKQIIDWRVLTFTFGISVATIFFFGVAPALFAARVDLNDALKSGARGATGGRGSQRFRNALVIGQFALAMILVAGGGFFVRGAQNALGADNGWNAEGVIQGGIQLPKGHPGGEKLEQFRQEAMARVKRIPSVQAVSFSYGMPYRGLNNIRGYLVQGREEPQKGQEPRAHVNGITSGYFDVTGTRLLRGRSFDERDNATSPDVAIISDSMARSLFGTESPLGKRIAVAGWNPLVWMEVVGVVADVQPADVAQDAISSQVYQPITQDDWHVAEGKLAELYLAARVSGVKPESIAPAIRSEVSAINPDLPVRELLTAPMVVERALSQLYLIGKLVGGFAALGAFLAGLGIYGVIARTVAQRTNEIGIRMALGARVADVVNMILGSGIRLALGGAALGFFGALGLAKLLASILPSMETNNVFVLLATTGSLCAIALIAAYAPARRAARIDPVEALRVE